MKIFIQINEHKTAFQYSSKQYTDILEISFRSDT